MPVARVARAGGERCGAVRAPLLFDHRLERRATPGQRFFFDERGDAVPPGAERIVGVRMLGGDEDWPDEAEDRDACLVEAQALFDGIRTITRGSGPLGRVAQAQAVPVGHCNFTHQHRMTTT